MTEIPPSLGKSTPLSVFLNSVCPGLPYLDDNTHFTLENSLNSTELHAIQKFNWPLTGLNASTSVKAQLEPVYLNVARPPFQRDIRRNIESTTYVSLPLHFTSLFTKLVTEGGDQKQDGGKHIGANVNPLAHDPFRLVHLNTGCVSSIITLHNHQRTADQHGADLRNPFNKMTSSINKILRIGVTDTSQADHWHPLLSEIEADGQKTPFRKTSHESLIISSVIDFDKKHFLAEISSPKTTKILVSVNVNVVNVFAIGEDNSYSGTTNIQTTANPFPQPATPPVFSTHSSSASSNLVQTLVPPYKKVIERPILRLQLSSHVMVTSLLTISSDTLTVMGLSNGDIVLINLSSLSFRHLHDLGNHTASLQPSRIKAVTSLFAINHPARGLLVIAGFATGEVVILDPNAGPKKLEGLYTKTVVGSDQFITYFKLFDLSGWGKSEVLSSDHSSPDYLVGHFKLSHKPITAIASTIPYESLIQNPHKPMILAFASDDGLVRFVDLIATYGKNYGNPNKFYSLSILTDVVSNYFQDGVRDIQFSPDNKFFVSCGKGDLIEIFKMSYYNVNALLRKTPGNSSNKPGRSRSGTINSSNSSNLQLLASFLGLGSASTSLDLPRVESSETYYAPVIKDISIVSRLKGHMNIVTKVSFLEKNQHFNAGESLSTGTYNLITCGNDGKINLWEFNNKALPRIKKSHFTTSAKRLSHHAESSPTPQVPSLSSKGKSIAVPTTGRTHRPSRSFNYSDDFPLHSSFSKLGINSLLSAHPQTTAPPENVEDQLEIVFSLYRSLYEMRLKKHYAKQRKDLKMKYPGVVHGIVNDKELPSIQIPLLTMDLSCLVRHGQISSFQCSSKDLWIFGKSGDIFRYIIGT